MAILPSQWESFYLEKLSLTHWDWDKMAALFKTAFLNAYFLMKIYKFWS